MATTIISLQSLLRDTIAARGLDRIAAIHRIREYAHSIDINQLLREIDYLPVSEQQYGLLIAAGMPGAAFDKVMSKYYAQRASKYF